MSESLVMFTAKASLLSEEATVIAEVSAKTKMENQHFDYKLREEESKRSSNLSCNILHEFQNFKKKERMRVCLKKDEA